MNPERLPRVVGLYTETISSRFPQRRFFSPIVHQISANTPSDFQVSFATVPSYNFTVQSTPALGGLFNWSNLSAITGADSVAPVTFTDTNQATAEFYRLVREPTP